MTIYVVIREDQNEHGFIDESILGVFQREADAEARAEGDRAKSRSEGLIFCGEEQDVMIDWQVDWRIEAHLLR